MRRPPWGRGPTSLTIALASLSRKAREWILGHPTVPGNWATALGRGRCGSPHPGPSRWRGRPAPVTLGWRASATCEVAGPKAGLGADGDGHGFHGGAVGDRSVLRRPARCLLHKACVAGLAALAVVWSVAGVRDAAAGAGAWSDADHGQRDLCGQREWNVRCQRAVSPRQLECHLAPAPAATGSRDDLLPHRRHGDTRLPPCRPRHLRAGLPDPHVGSDGHGGRSPYGADEHT